MQIDAQLKDLGELLAGNNRYEVPMYQRNYAWKNEQIDAFLEDISIAIARNDDHFFGSIVLLEGNRNRPHSLIDGQQRMTTFVLLIAAIRDFIHGFENRQVLVHGHPRNLGDITANLLHTENDFSLRFISNNRIKSIFDTHIQFEPDAVGRKHFTVGGAGLSSVDKRNTGELRRAFLRISKWLNTYLHDFAGNDDALKEQAHKMLMTIRNNVKILRISVMDEDDAFLLFETLNDRGLRLTPSDLLKSFTLRQIDDGGSVATAEEALDRWDDAVETLGDYPFTKFLRHFLLSVQGEKVQVSKIFALFKSRIKQFGTGGALRNLHELGEAARNYSILLGESSSGDQTLDKAIVRLNLVSETHRVVLLRAMSFRFENSALRRLALALENLSFRWVLTGGNAQQIEDFYQDMAEKFTSDDLSELSEVIREVQLKTPPSENVHTAIVQNPARKDTNFQFYVLQRLNKAQSGIDLVIDRRNLHIEHLAPQRPFQDAGWYESVAPQNAVVPGDRVYEDFLNQWGNLTLLEWEINSSVGNASWTAKRDGRDADKGIVDSNVAITKDLARCASWTADIISRRTEWIADAIVAITEPNSYEDAPRISAFK